jgi:holo-[acyl-carrier protein] synthase
MDMFFIGCDIEEISRFEGKNEDKEFLNILFSKNEQQYCLSNDQYAQHLAARFCGKEAIIKACYSAGIIDISYGDLEIINDEDGVPRVNFLKDIPVIPMVQVSLSHCKNYAMANAIITI